MNSIVVEIIFCVRLLSDLPILKHKCTVALFARLRQCIPLAVEAVLLQAEAHKVALNLSLGKRKYWAIARTAKSIDRFIESVRDNMGMTTFYTSILNTTLARANQTEGGSWKWRWLPCRVDTKLHFQFFDIERENRGGIKRGGIQRGLIQMGEKGRQQGRQRERYKRSKRERHKTGKKHWERDTEEKTSGRQ